MSEQRVSAHSAEYYSGLINALIGVVWEFDWSTGAFTFASGACEQLLGFPREDWLKPGFWLERLHPDDREWATGYCVAATEDGLDHDFEYRMVRADGTIVWVRDLVTVDPNLRMAGRLKGLLIDITERRAAVDALVHAEQRYRGIIENSRLIAAEVDVNGTITFCNDAACELMGMDRDQIEGRPFLTLVAEEEREHLAAAHAGRMQGALSLDVVPITVVGCDGVRHHVRFHTSVLYDLSGAPVGAVVLGEDVTERAELERRLARKAENFESIFRLTGDLFFRMDHDGTYTDYAAPLDDQLYAPPDAFLGRSYRDVLPPEISDLVTAGLNDAHHSGQMRTFDYEMTVPGNEARRWEARLLPLDAGDTAVISRDITRRVARETALTVSEQRYRHVVEDSPFGMHFHEAHPDGRVVFVNANAAAADLTGIDYGPLIGLELAEAFPSLDSEVHHAYAHIALHGGVFHKESIPYRLPAGQRYFDLTIFQTQPGQAAGVFADVTARCEAAEKEAAYKDRLRAMASELTRTEDRERHRLAEELHDRVSQSLAVARMHMDGARSTGDAEEAAQSLERAQYLLEQAIAETRTITTELAPPVLYELGLGSALLWICDQMEAAHDLTVDLDIDFVERRLDDDTKMVLFRSCRELLMNVVKHAGIQRARVTLCDQGERVSLTVEDNGAGFDPEDAESAAAGGFGLFSIRERLPHLGGEFAMCSAPGEGTTVTVTVLVDHPTV